MDIRTTKLAGVCEIHPTAHKDTRGYFARTYCAQEWETAGLDPVTTQMALSHSNQRGVLRGLHVIPEDIGEAKLVRCVRGAIFDVAVDLRRSSKTFRQWIGLELTADKLTALYLPRGVAHGFLTLQDHTDVAYQFSQPHRPGIETGIRWDDPDIAVDWPFEPEIISERDAALPMLAESALA